MAFGQQSGPPATHRQVQDLLELVIAAGHRDFRDARGPLGLTQRQAAGKFTRDEADALIEQLQAESDAAEAGVDQTPEVEPPATPSAAAMRPKANPVPKASGSSAVAAARARREAEAMRQVRDLPDQVLAAELQRRGWVVMEP